MAGIGFVLRKLAQQDNLLGVLRAYGHAALASSGPWLFTVCALGLLMLINSAWATRLELYEFRLLIIYNFAFSLVFSAPVYMVATRYLADSIHHKDVSHAPGMLFAYLLLLCVTQLPIVSYFYLGYAELSPEIAVLAIINYVLIMALWLISVFLTALKDFRTITWSFGLGVCATLLASAVFAQRYGTAGMLCGFNLGMAGILFALIARILAEYPYRLEKPKGIFAYFARYWEIALGGFLFNVASWVDKWIMWFAPEAERMPSKLLLYSNYDSAMFLAYLTIVPAMAAFVFSVETRFFERYLQFYNDIQQQATFRRIQDNHKALVYSVFNGARNFLILQGSITFVVILTAPALFNLLHINFLQLGIFRFGVLGALLHVLVLFLSILLSYFDHRKAALMIAAVFLLTNILCTLWSMELGFPYYGYGYFLSTLITFLFSALLFARYIRKLPYHTFIRATRVPLPVNG